ncbi:unnamed protein product [Sphacelaria rigidula]
MELLAAPSADCRIMPCRWQGEELIQHRCSRVRIANGRIGRKGGACFLILYCPAFFVQARKQGESNGLYSVDFVVRPHIHMRVSIVVVLGYEQIPSNGSQVVYSPHHYYRKVFSTPFRVVVCNAHLYIYIYTLAFFFFLGY